MKKYDILVADPNETVRKLLCFVFGEDRFALTFVSDGEEALGQALVDPPDLVITEMRLDRLDGVALCEQLKRDPRTRPARVLFLTTSASELDARRARRAGADGYLTKPFSPRVLLRQVGELLRGSQAAGPPEAGPARGEEGCG